MLGHGPQPTCLEVFAAPTRQELNTLVLSFLFDQRSESRTLPRDILVFSVCSRIIRLYSIRFSVPSVADEAILAKHRKVTHAMLVTTDGLPDRPQYLNRAWKAACGARMRHQDTTFLDEWSNNPAFCQHAACRKVWKALSLT